MITKIHGTRNTSVRRCPHAVQKNIYMEDFVYKANLELDRVSRFAFTTEYEGLDKYLNGRRVFIGDFVHVLDSNHDYNEWIVMVNGIKSCGMLRCSLGIQSCRFRKTAERDKEAERDRP